MKKLLMILVLLLFMASLTNAAFVGLNTVSHGGMTWSVQPNPYITTPAYADVLIGNSTLAQPGYSGKVNQGAFRVVSWLKLASADVVPAGASQR